MGSCTRFVSLIVSVLFLASAAAAQRPDSTASVVGRVFDTDGKALESAVVRAGSTAVATDASGLYRVEHLPAGRISALVRRIGYAPRDTTLTLSANRTTHWDVRLTHHSFGQLSAADVRKNRIADSANVANGMIDSAAAGLIPSHGAGDPPYEKFGARLLGKLALERGADSNTVISPLSAGMALALAASGASGLTFAGLTRALDARSLRITALAQRDSLLLNTLSKRSDVVLEVSNALWLSPNYRIQPDYATKASSAYASRVTAIDLRRQAGIDVVNEWANEKTHGKIPKIFGGPLSDTSALVITNAVYFHGLWLKAFDKAATRPMAFHRRAGVTDSVPGMERREATGYFRGAAMQAIRLPYRSGRAALYVILPDSGTRVEDAEALLANGGLPHLASAFKFRDVHLRLPRVHAEATMSLAVSLKALGATVAFDCDRADFRSMLVLKPGENACIRNVTQKTYIDIDEVGTVAAAVTAIEMMTTTSAPPPPIEFIVDRPFLIVLRDEVSGVPLFMGRIVNPGTSIRRN
ncbi:MAG: serpin family protein [bacterium]